MKQASFSNPGQVRPKSCSKSECLKSLVGGLRYGGVGKMVVSVLDCKSHIQPLESNDQDEF